MLKMMAAAEIKDRTPKIKMPSATIAQTLSTTYSPEGLAFDGTNLITGDYGSKRIRVNRGVTTSTASSLSIGSKYAYDIGFMNGDLIVAGGSGFVNIHNGMSSTVRKSFNTPYTGTIGGVAWHDGKLILTSYSGGNGKIHIYSDTGTKLSEIAAPSTSSLIGLCVVSGNLIIGGYSPGKIWIMDGISSSIKKTISTSYDVTGLAHDGENLISCSYGQRKIYIHKNEEQDI